MLTRWQEKGIFLAFFNFKIMSENSERFGYSDASRAEREIRMILRDHGMNPEKVKQMVILGSGLGGFGKDYLGADKAWEPSGPVRIPFGTIYSKLDGGSVSSLGSALEGHDRSLIIGPMKGSTDGSLVFAQSGREHPYEGASTMRATFWLRVAQLMGVRDLIGSNAAGILTPQSLQKDSIMLVHSDKDCCDDSPLVGPNDERFGPRIPHRADSYPVEVREIVKRLAAEMGIGLKEGTYVRKKGPNYESVEEVYELRAGLRGMWKEGNDDGDVKFKGDVRGAVGMSSTFENLVAQQASQSREHPAFANRAYLSALTNYAALLGPRGLEEGILDHGHVKESAGRVQEDMGRLVQATLLELRKAA